MRFEEYRELLVTAFPDAVRSVIAENDSSGSRAVQELKQHCSTHHLEWGFSCAADAWDAAVPKSDRLSLFTWSTGKLTVDRCLMEISCKAFYISDSYVHIEIRNQGTIPLPFTETGYRSDFIPLQAFSNGSTVEEERGQPLHFVILILMPSSFDLRLPNATKQTY